MRGGANSVATMVRFEILGGCPTFNRSASFGAARWVTGGGADREVGGADLCSAATLGAVELRSSTRVAAGGVVAMSRSRGRSATYARPLAAAKTATSSAPAAHGQGDCHNGTGRLAAGNASASRGRSVASAAVGTLSSGTATGRRQAGHATHRPAARALARNRAPQCPHVTLIVAVALIAASGVGSSEEPTGEADGESDRKAGPTNPDSDGGVPGAGAGY